MGTLAATAYSSAMLMLQHVGMRAARAYCHLMPGGMRGLQPCGVRIKPGALDVPPMLHVRHESLTVSCQPFLRHVTFVTGWKLAFAGLRHVLRPEEAPGGLQCCSAVSTGTP